MSKQPTHIEVLTFAYGQNIKAEVEGWARQHEARILSVSLDRSAHSLANPTLLVSIVWEPLAAVSEEGEAFTSELTSANERLMALALKQQEQIKQLVEENAQLRGEK